MLRCPLGMLGRSRRVWPTASLLTWRSIADSTGIGMMNVTLKTVRASDTLSVSLARGIASRRVFGVEEVPQLSKEPPPLRTATPSGRRSGRFSTVSSDVPRRQNLPRAGVLNEEIRTGGAISGMNSLTAFPSAPQTPRRGEERSRRRGRSDLRPPRSSGACSLH